MIAKRGVGTFAGKDHATADTHKVSRFAVLRHLLKVVSDFACRTELGVRRKKRHDFWSIRKARQLVGVWRQEKPAKSGRKATPRGVQ
jgi:hypothetical protein